MRIRTAEGREAASPAASGAREPGHCYKDRGEDEGEGRDVHRIVKARIREEIGEVAETKPIQEQSEFVLKSELGAWNTWSCVGAQQRVILQKCK